MRCAALFNFFALSGQDSLIESFRTARGTFIQLSDLSVSLLRDSATADRLWGREKSALPLQPGGLSCRHVDSRVKLGYCHYGAQAHEINSSPNFICELESQLAHKVILGASDRTTASNQPAIALVSLKSSSFRDH